MGDNIVSKIQDVYPNPNGTISFLWENYSNERISLEIGNSSMSYYSVLEDQSEPVMFDDVEISTNSANQLSKLVAEMV